MRKQMKQCRLAEEQQLRWIFVFFVCAILIEGIIVTKGLTQTAQKLTEEEFIEKTRNAIEKGNSLEVAKLIKETPYWVEPAVSKFLDAYIEAFLKDSAEKAAQHLLLAKTTAGVYRDVFGKDNQLKNVVRFQGWSRDEKAKKVLVDSLHEAGTDSAKNSVMPAAKEKLSEALRISREIGYKEGEAKAIANLGNVWWHLGKLTNAKSSFEAALQIDLEMDDRKGEANELGSLASLYGQLRQFEKSYDFYQQALAIDRELGDRVQEGIHLGNLGANFSNRGDYEKATFYYEKSLEIANKLDSKREIGMRLGNLAIVYFRQGDHEKALDYFNQTIDLFTDLKNRKEVAVNINNRAYIYSIRGQYKKALEDYESAFSVAKEIDYLTLEATTAGNLGVRYSIIGDFQKALDFLNQAIEINRKMDDKSSIGRHLSNIGIVYDDLGNYQKSLEYKQAALKIARELVDRGAECIRLGNIGSAYALLNDNKNAIAYYDSSLRIAQELVDTRQEGIVLSNLGSCYYNLKNNEKAIAFYDSAISIIRNIRDRSTEGDILNNLGNVYADLEALDKAENLYQKSLEIRKQLGEEGKELECLYNLAGIYHQKDDLGLALESCKDALTIIESLWKKLRVDEYRQVFLGSKIFVYERMVNLLLQTKQPEQAFYYAEKSKARSLLDIVHQGQIYQTIETIPEDLREKLLVNRKNVENKHNALRTELAKPEAEKDQRHILALREEINTLESEKAGILNEIKAAHPDFHRLTNPTTLTLASIQDTVLQNRNQKIIEYFVGNKQTVVWVVSKDTMHCDIIEINRDSLHTQLEAVSANLFGGKKDAADQDSASQASNTVRDQGWADINFEALHNLYETIFAPAAQHLNPGDELTIIPSDMLFYFPFEMMATEIKGDSVSYLVEDYPISYASSASLLNPELFRKREPVTGDLLAFGNPDFGNKQESGFIDFVKSLLPTSWRAVVRGDNLAQLPYSEDEVKEIAKNFRTPKVYIGKAATEGKAKQEAKNHRFLHFSTHNIVNDTQPMYSQIVLAQPYKVDGDSTAPDEDGFLHTYEVFNLRTNAEMVVLSACNTGLGKFSRGEGLIGMSRAFMYAGTPTLVVSQWVVEDRSTSQLMRKFYRYLKDGMNKRQALRQAKLDLIRSEGKEANPFYWAPFILIGDWSEVAF